MGQMVHRETAMTKEEIRSQLGEMLLRRVELKREISAIRWWLKDQGDSLAEMGRRLKLEPESFSSEYRCDFGFIAKRIEQVRQKSAQLEETQAYLKSQGCFD